MIRANTLADLSGVQHRFFTRHGGVSAGLYSSLNCGYGSGDQPDNVRENRRRAAACFVRGADELLTVHQTHSTDVLTVGKERWTSPGAPKADALVTDRPGVVLGVLAADCAPVLLADPQARVIGAAHAGWKGALAGVVEATVSAMEKLGARRERVRAAIGPCIGRDSYEVGPEFPAPFLKRDAADAALFRAAPRVGHFLFDLAGYLAHRIAKAGVAVEVTGYDTLRGEADFFSYRRNTLNGVRDYGRGLSAIALED
jgi:YfiH family protein